MMIPNAEHSLLTGILEAVPAIGAFVQALLYKDPVPGFTWEVSETNGDITVTLDDVGKVHSATMWYSHSCGENAWDNNTKRRDWRVAHLDNPCTCGPLLAGYCVNLKTAWMKTELNQTMVKGKRTYTAHQETPTDGSWMAFFIDIKYHNPHSLPIDLEALHKSINVDANKPKTIGQQVREVFPEFGGFPHDFGGFFEFTSEVSIWPTNFPYPDCSGVECGNRLV